MQTYRVIKHGTISFTNFPGSIPSFFASFLLLPFFPSALSLSSMHPSLVVTFHSPFSHNFVLLYHFLLLHLSFLSTFLLSSCPPFYFLPVHLLSSFLSTFLVPSSPHSQFHPVHLLSSFLSTFSAPSSTFPVPSCPPSQFLPVLILCSFLSFFALFLLPFIRF